MKFGNARSGAGLYAQSEVQQMTEYRTGFPDRRRSERFPIAREVRYRAVGKRELEVNGQGITVNFSSSGILFTSQHAFSHGQRLQLCISWPAQLNDKCALKLVARGRVVRCEEGFVAVEIQQHEFRTATLSPNAPTPHSPKDDEEQDAD